MSHGMPVKCAGPRLLDLDSEVAAAPGQLQVELICKDGPVRTGLSCGGLGLGVRVPEPRGCCWPGYRPPRLARTSSYPVPARGSGRMAMTGRAPGLPFLRGVPQAAGTCQLSDGPSFDHPRAIAATSTPGDVGLSSLAWVARIPNRP